MANITNYFILHHNISNPLSIVTNRRGHNTIILEINWNVSSHKFEANSTNSEWERVLKQLLTTPL